MKLVIGSDHAGFELKEAIKPYLIELGHTYTDFGTFDGSAPVDWPDIAFLVAQSILRGEFDCGILIDGVGTAMPIVANRLPGIRAMCCYDAFTTQMSREHGDANIMCLGGYMTGKGLAKLLVKQWLSTEFLGGRYLKRLDKVKSIEQVLYKPELFK
ncbi:MAG: ribose 5-phosphate isomerase B [bacterium]